MLSSQYEDVDKLREFCTRYNWKLATLRRRIREHREYQRIFHADLAHDIQIAEGSSELYLDYPIIDGSQVIISDIEMPDQFGLMLRLATLVGISRDIPNLAVIGDAIATDQAALNTWTTTWLMGDKAFEDTVENDLLHNFREMGKWFTKVRLTEANHDIRLAKATQGQVHLGMLLKGSIVEYSRYEYLYIESPRGWVKCVHPRNFSQEPITLGQQIYAVEQGPHFNPLDPFGTFRKAHIVVAHCHRQQASMSPDGVFEIHSLGTLRHPQKTQYLQKATTKFRKWDTGFLVLDRGFFYPMKLNGTDWCRELGGNDGLYKTVKDELEFVLYPRKA